MDFTDKEQAISYAIAVNEQQAYPVLVMSDGKTYKVGSRVEKDVRTFGKHLATVSRLGGVNYDDCIIGKPGMSLPDHRCLCE